MHKVFYQKLWRIGSILFEFYSLFVKVVGRQKVNHNYKTMVGACAYN